MRLIPALCAEASDQTGTKKEVEEDSKERIILSSEREAAAMWSRKAYTNRATMSPPRTSLFSGRGGRRSLSFRRSWRLMLNGFLGLVFVLSLFLLSMDDICN